jgi:hypothetical protein
LQVVVQVVDGVVRAVVVHQAVAVLVVFVVP